MSTQIASVKLVLWGGEERHSRLSAKSEVEIVRRQYEGSGRLGLFFFFLVLRQVVITIRSIAFRNNAGGRKVLVVYHRRLYSPGWALASSTKCRQRPLSRASARQFLQPSFFASSSTPSIHLDFGRPRPRWPPRFAHNIFLGNLFSPIRATWPSHLSLLVFITLTVFGCL